VQPSTHLGSGTAADASAEQGTSPPSFPLTAAATTAAVVRPLRRSIVLVAVRRLATTRPGTRLVGVRPDVARDQRVVAVTGIRPGGAIGPFERRASWCTCIQDQRRRLIDNSVAQLPRSEREIQAVARRIVEVQPGIEEPFHVVTMASQGFVEWASPIERPASHHHVAACYPVDDSFIMTLIQDASRGRHRYRRQAVCLPVEVGTDPRGRRPRDDGWPCRPGRRAIRSAQLVAVEEGD
jgi:hypothetical protein